MSKFTYFYGNQPYEFERFIIPPEEVEYTEKDILDQIHFLHGTNEIKFRYDLLDKHEQRKKSLRNVIDAEISMAAFAEVKRTAKFKLLEEEEIDWLNDRIQPFAMLRMPNGSWVEWSLGIFILSSPNRVEENGAVYRDIEAYDGLIVLKDDKFLERYTINEGTNYIDAINEILDSSNISKINIEANANTLNRTKEFEPGTEKLKAINELLSDINWTTLWVDEMGYYTSSRYRSPADRSANIRYFDDELSILSPGMSEDLDLVNVANSWVVVASNPEEEPLDSSYQNNNPDSPTSTVNRGRVIADYREIESIASQEALDAYVERLAFNASQIYGYLQFTTAINPLHSYSDVINVRYRDLGIEDKYAETNWSMKLKGGSLMSHETRKVVYI